MSEREPIRVAYVDQLARPSGAQLALVRLLVALGERVEAHVLLAEDGPLVAELEKAGAVVEVVAMAPAALEVRIPQVRPGGFGLRPAGAAAAYVARLTRRLRGIAPDLVHTNSLKTAVAGGVAARLAGLPVVWQIRDRIAPDYLPVPAVHLVRALGRVLPHAVLAHQTSLPTLGRSGPPRFAVVDAVDPRCFDVAEPPPAAGRELMIGIVGRVTSWKGQHVFLDAFARAFPDGGPRAVVVGAPLHDERPYEMELHALAASLGIADRVEFRGFRRDVPAELGRLDVVVHASVIPEPFGQVVTEAMAAGRPVVAAAAGGPTTIVTDGVDGLLTPPGDAPALAAALRRLAGDAGLRAALGRAARRRARDFSGEAAAAPVLAAYREVLARGR